MPNPVLGGAAVVLFGMIFSIGLRIITRGSDLSQRNLTIIATSIVLGVGVEWRSDALAQLPDDIQVLATSGLIVGGVTALVMNAVLPEDAAPMGEGAVGDPVAGEDPRPAPTTDGATVEKRNPIFSNRLRRYSSVNATTRETEDSPPRNRHGNVPICTRSLSSSSGTWAFSTWTIPSGNSSVCMSW